MDTDDPANQNGGALDRELLERCMAAMADGDSAFVFTFIFHFGGALARVVRSILAEMGRTDVLADRDEVDALVQDTAFVIFDAAGGWNPDGALPWTWAYRAIRSEVARRVGHRTVGSDENLDVEADIVSPAHGAALGVDDLDALAARHETVQLLVDLAHAAGSQRDAAVFLQYRLQRRNGDPSPAHTIAAMFGLSPVNVRQIHSRMSTKVRALADSDARFAPLSDLPFLAA